MGVDTDQPAADDNFRRALAPSFESVRARRLTFSDRYQTNTVVARGPPRYDAHNFHLFYLLIIFRTKKFRRQQINRTNKP